MGGACFPGRSGGFFLPDKGGQSLLGLSSSQPSSFLKPSSLWFQEKRGTLTEPHFLHRPPTPDLLTPAGPGQCFLARPHLHRPPVKGTHGEEGVHRWVLVKGLGLEPFALRQRLTPSVSWGFWTARLSVVGAVLCFCRTLSSIPPRCRRHPQDGHKWPQNCQLSFTGR